jgi:hypothetical protein
MRARLHLQQFCDVSKVTPELQPLITWIPGRNAAGQSVSVAVYAAGTIFEGPIALQLCRTGQAAPADDECAAALNMTQHEIDVLKIEYEMNALGINNQGDRDLYRAGVILGYNKDQTYKPGPKWDEYHQAKQALEEAEL